MLEKYLVKGLTSRSSSLPAVNFAGLWTNELDSEMELSVSGEQLSGAYRTGVGAPTPTEEFSLMGFVSGDLISFTVNFGEYSTLTSWVGQHTVEDGVEKIYTLWHLAKNIKDEDEPANLWAGILAGANTFVRK